MKTRYSHYNLDIVPRRSRGFGRFSEIFRALASIGTRQAQAPTRTSESASSTSAVEPQNTNTRDEAPVAERAPPATADVKVVEDTKAAVESEKEKSLNVSTEAVEEAKISIVQDCAVLELPTEIILHVCSFLVQPRDVFMLAATCRALRRLLVSDWSNNRFWYNYLDHTPHQRAVSAVYKSWKEDEVQDLLKLLFASGATTRQYGYEEFLKVPRWGYKPTAGYKFKTVKRLKWAKAGSSSEFCYGCFLPSKLPQPEFWVHFFCVSGPVHRYKNRTNLWFCMNCVGEYLTTRNKRPYSKLDVSSVPDTSWPYQIDRFESLFRHIEGGGTPTRFFGQDKPDMTPQLNDALFGRSMHAKFREMGGSGKTLYLRKDLNKALLEQYYVSIMDWPEVEAYQDKQYHTLRTAILEGYTERIAKGEYTRFNRTNILGPSHLSEYLDEEWKDFKCLWGLPEDCPARVKFLDKKYDVKTAEEHENTNIFESIYDPPAAQQSDLSTTLTSWATNSANIILNTFVCDPVLPLSPNAYNKKNFVQSHVWLHNSDRFYKRSSRKAGQCIYCPESKLTYYTPYYYALHLLSDHEFEFYNRSWRWRLRGNRYQEATTEVSAPENYSIAGEKQYGPLCVWKKGEGLIFKSWGYYYIH